MNLLYQIDVVTHQSDEVDAVSLIAQVDDGLWWSCIDRLNELTINAVNQDVGDLQVVVADGYVASGRVRIGADTLCVVIDAVNGKRSNSTVDQAFFHGDSLNRERASVDGKWLAVKIWGGVRFCLVCGVIDGGIFRCAGDGVRDKFLKRENHDEDYCVTGLTVDKFKKIFPEAFLRGKAFEVFDLYGMEFAMARKEQKTGLGHKEFEITTGEDILIEETEYIVAKN